MIREIKQSGYTLLELLLYIAIISGLLVSITMFYGTAMDARVKNQSIAEVEQQGQLALEHMSQTIRNATSITTPAAGATGATLTLVVPTGALSPTTFDVAAGTLRVKEGAPAAVPLTNDKVEITALTFRNLSRPSTPGIIQVSMTLARVNDANRNEYDYQKTFTTSASLRWP